MFTDRRKREWWEAPTLAKRKVSVPRHFRNHDPLTSNLELPKQSATRVGAFNPSRKWVPYRNLAAVEVGYLVPVYDLRQIALRFGLSHNGQRYFRKHILPEPFDIVRRRSVSAHHWSRFTLMALDIVLGDLEQRGYLQILSSFTEHVEMVQVGTQYMEDYYTEQAERKSTDPTDKFGVQWF